MSTTKAKIKFAFLALAMCLLSTEVAYAQPYDAQAPCQEIPTDKKPGYYGRNVNRAMKANDYQSAAVFGCYKLNMARRKKPRQKALEQLETLVAEAAVLPRRIHSLDSISQEVVGERSIDDRRRLQCEYGKYAQLHAAYATIPDELRSATLDDAYTTVDTYDDEYAAAGDSVRSAEAQVAELYYRSAMQLTGGSGRRNSLEILKLCDRGLHLDRSHVGLRTLRDEHAAQGLGRVAIEEVQNASGVRTEAKGEVQRYLVSTLQKRLAQTRYFELDGGQPNIVIQVRITSLATTRVRPEPSVTEREKKLSDDRVVKAKLIRHSKDIIATLTGSYVVTDTQAGEVLASGELTAAGINSQEWYTYTGSKSALKKRDLNRLSSEPEWASPELARADGLQNLGMACGKRAGTLFTQRSQLTPIQVFDSEILAASK